METSQTTNKVRGRSRLKKEVSNAPLVKKKRADKKKINIRWTQLILALLSFLILLLMLFNFSPEQLNNFILPNSFLPLLIVFAAFVYFLAQSFRLQASPSWTIALSFTLLLFLLLQELTFNLWLLPILIIPSLSHLIFDQIRRRLL